MTDFVGLATDTFDSQASLNAAIKKGAVKLDIDPTLAANSDDAVPTQKAVKAAIALIPKGDTGAQGIQGIQGIQGVAGAGSTFVAVPLAFGDSPYTPQDGRNETLIVDTAGGDVVVNYPAVPSNGQTLRIFNVNGGNTVQAPGLLVVTPQSGGEVVYNTDSSAFWQTGCGANGGATKFSVVQLDAGAKLPAVDGSQLTNLPSGGSTVVPKTAPGVLVTPGAGGSFGTPLVISPTAGKKIIHFALTVDLFDNSNPAYSVQVTSTDGVGLDSTTFPAAANAFTEMPQGRFGQMFGDGSTPVGDIHVQMSDPANGVVPAYVYCTWLETDI